MDADRGLVDAAAGGDRRAFDELVARYQRQIVNLARAMTASDADADDLAQDVFVRVWRSLAGFRGESTFKTWLYGIAVNVVRTHRGRQSRLLRMFRNVQAEPDADPLEDAVDRDESVERTLVLRDASTFRMSAWSSRPSRSSRFLCSRRARSSGSRRFSKTPSTPEQQIAFEKWVEEERGRRGRGRGRGGPSGPRQPSGR